MERYTIEYDAELQIFRIMDESTGKAVQRFFNLDIAEQYTEMLNQGEAARRELNALNARCAARCL